MLEIKYLILDTRKRSTCTHEYTRANSIECFTEKKAKSNQKIIRGKAEIRKAVNQKYRTMNTQLDAVF